jgi:hypothetical protein
MPRRRKRRNSQQKGTDYAPITDSKNNLICMMHSKKGPGLYIYFEQKMVITLVGARRPSGSCSISIRNPDTEGKRRTQAGEKCVAGFENRPNGARMQNAHDAKTLDYCR